jgi:hypothetical protein
LNSDASQIRAQSIFEPLITVEERQELLQILDKRGGTQRNKPRSQDPARNPLGGSVIDMACGWPMYRQPYGQTFRYTCGLYQQSHGQKCEHNHIDGPLAAEFVLRCLRQRLLTLSTFSRLKNRLHELATEERRKGKAIDAKDPTRDGLEQVRREIKQAERNLALATSPENFRGIEGIVAELRAREQSLAAQQAASETRALSAVDSEAEVGAALKVLDRLAELASQGHDYALAREAFELANAKLFLRFQAVAKKRRTVNRIASGVVTLGTAPPPVALYAGPTGRKRVKELNPGDWNDVKEKGGRRSPTESKPQDPGREGSSLGNVSRDDRTPIELFVEACSVVSS